MTVLLVGEDPGGIDVIVPIKRRLDALGEAAPVVCSGPGRPVWQRHGIAFEDITDRVADPVNAEAVRTLIAAHRPNILVTSTSFPRKMEKVFRREAKALGIPTVMVLDADRSDLYRPEPEELACRPDLALSIGGRMTTQLEAAGYAKVVTTGHLAFADIVGAGAVLSADDVAVWRRDVLRADPSRELVVVFSDNISQVFGEDGAIAEIGYHERIAVPDLLRAIAAIAKADGRRFDVVVKLHPKEDRGAFDAVFAELSGPEIVFREIAATDNIRLILAADHIVGMYSIIMVWSALLGRTTLSYQPDARKDTLLVTAHDGAVPLCTKRTELDGMVRSFLADPIWRARWQTVLAGWQPPLDGLDRAISAISALAQGVDR